MAPAGVPGAVETGPAGERAAARVAGLVEFVGSPIAVAVLARACSQNGPHDLDLGQVFSIFHVESRRST